MIPVKATTRYARIKKLRKQKYLLRMNPVKSVEEILAVTSADTTKLI